MATASKATETLAPSRSQPDKAISLITPPGAVMLGWAIGGETFSVLSLVGACFVLAGVWMIFRRAEMREPVIQEG